MARPHHRRGDARPRQTRGSRQHRGIGTAVVRLAVAHARAAGCEWLHVDFDPALRPFYIDACGFRPTDAGLIHLPSTSSRPEAERPHPRR
ncbi:MAG TPA: GNAT family N-acetyltransferase [Thermomonospora sp.]|nr:GNAT family N-acetyltransferase [Thermomonospora sp.]